MRFPVDLSLFAGTAHSPSFLALQRSMGRPDLRLRDYCIPVNPYFPTRAMFAEFHARLGDALKYYPGSIASLAEVVGRTLGLAPETIVPANGSTELITWVDRLLVKEGLATPVPTFGRWTDQPTETGKRMYPFELRAEEGFALDIGQFAGFVHETGAGVAAICNPNNPTGGLLSRREVSRLLDLLADLDLVVIDESFIDFSSLDDVPSVATEAARRGNVLVLKSLGKNFGMHGMRLGYGVAHPRLAARLREALPHWNVNGVAEMVLRTIGDHLEEYELGRRRVVLDREEMEEGLGRIEGLTAFPSRANFAYVRLPEGIDGVEFRDCLLSEYGCLVRECGSKLGSDSHYFRIACRPAEEMAILFDAMAACLADRQPATVPVGAS